jgi:hypothetical protein
VIEKPCDVASTKKTFDIADPVIAGVHVYYSENHKLFEMVNADALHWRKHFASAGTGPGQDP